MKSVIASAIFLFPFIAIAVFIAVRAVRARRRRETYDLPPASPSWTDVGSQVGRIRRRSLAWATVAVTRRTMVGGGVVLFVADYFGAAENLTGDRSPSGGVPFFATVCALILGGLALTPLCRALRDPLYSDEVYETDERRPSSAIGLGLRFIAKLLILPAVFIPAAFQVGDLITLGSVGQSQADGAGPSLTSVAGSFLLSEIFRYGLAAAMLALLGAAAVALDRLGLRLLTEEAQTLLQRDPRRPILYLRNFGDDEFRIEAAGPSRRGLVGKLAFRRTRPFEETFAWRLNQYGPLIAANDPNIRLRTLGAAKMHLPHVNWKDQVEAYAADSLAVVISATPTEINCGLLWELRMIAERLPHQRVILLLPPRRKRESEQGWTAFCNAVSGWAFFDGARAANPTGAAHLLVHVPGEGWRAWGAATRTEWTYVLAVRGCLDYATKAWQRTAPWLADARPAAARHRPMAATVRVGLRFMYAGIVLTLLNTLVTVPMLSRNYGNAALREASQDPIGNSDLVVSQAAMTISWFELGGLAATAAWTWVAFRCRKGNNWGRVLATCGCLLGTLFLLAKLLGDTRAHSWVSSIDAATALAGVTGVGLMWAGDSEQHFDSPTRATAMPASVRTALRLMYLGMALTLADVVDIGITRYFGYRHLAGHSDALTAQDAYARLVGGLVLLMAGGLICEGLWLSAVLGCRRGGHWGRILATIYFVVATFGILIRLLVETTLSGRLLDLTVLLVAATALCLLWSRPSGRYFRPQPGPALAYPGPPTWYP